MVRRFVILAVVLLFMLGAEAGWSWWAANAVTLPALPPNLHGQFALSPRDAESQRPCPEEPVSIHVRWMGPPDSLRRTVAAVDGVVVARMEQAPLDVIEIVHCLFVTLYPFTVEQSIKGSFRPGDAIQIRWGGRPIDTVEGLPRPRVGERFLFLLKNADSGPGYDLAYSPWEHYRIVDGRLVPLEGGRSGNAAGRRVKDFVAELRRMMGRN